jgi:hypothetical protein
MTIRISRATISGIGLVLVALIAGACDSSPKTTAPTFPTSYATTTIFGNTQSQVLGWVTTTLANGTTFVFQVPADAPYAQLYRAAQSLGTACTVSENELKDAAWSGRALAAKSALSSSLAATVALVAKPPASGFAAQLKSDIMTTSQKLKALADQVHG